MQKISSFLWVAVLCSVPLFYTSKLFLRPTDDAKEFLLYTLLFGFVSFNFKDIKIHSSLIFFVLVFYAYSLIHPFLASSPLNESLAASSKWGILLLALLCLSQKPTQHVIKSFRWLIVVGVLCVFVTPFYSERNTVFLVLPVGHVSYYSDFMMLLLPPSIYLAWISKNQKQRLFFILSTLLFLSQIWISARKSSFLGVLTGLVIFGVVVFFKATRKQQKKILSVVGGVFITVALIVFVIEGFGITHENKSETGASRWTEFVSDVSSGHYKDYPRYVMWQQSLEAVADKPFFGWGYGSFRYVYPKYFSGNLENPEMHLFLSQRPRWLMHPHNEPIHQIFEGGIIGGIFFLGLFFYICFKLILHIRKVPLQELTIPVFCLCGLCSLFVSNFFNTSLTNPVIRLVLLIYLALVVQIFENDGPSKFQVKIPKVVFAVVLFLGLPALGSVSASHFMSKARFSPGSSYHKWALFLSPQSFDVLYRSSVLEWKGGNREEALSLMVKCHELYPYVPMIYPRLAYYYKALGQKDSAQKILEDGLNLYPFYEPIQKMKFQYF